MIGFNISVSGIRAGLSRLDVAANNIANATTPGFKRSRVDQVDVSPGGTSVGSVSVRFNQGPLEIEDGRFSLAVEGDGFFQVQTPQGPRFTRAGSFHIDAAGQVVTSDGALLGITIPADATSISVGSDGAVSVTVDGQVVPLGQVALVRFANPGGLSQEGHNLASATPASGPPLAGAPASTLVFGAVEGSNVDLAQEIVGMILAKASVRANIAALKSQDETLGEIIDLRG